MHLSQMRAAAITTPLPTPTSMQLICLSDLEQDFINPHESAKRINRLVIPEWCLVGLQAFLALLLHKWVLVLVNLGIGFHAYKQYQLKRHTVDVTEIFKQLPREKKIR